MACRVDSLIRMGTTMESTESRAESWRPEKSSDSERIEEQHKDPWTPSYLTLAAKWRAAFVFLRVHQQYLVLGIRISSMSSSRSSAPCSSETRRMFGRVSMYPLCAFRASREPVDILKHGSGWKCKEIRAWKSYKCVGGCQRWKGSPPSMRQAQAANYLLPIP